MDLGTTIKNVRIQNGYKQNEFAKICNISQTYLSQLENNVKEPNISTLRIISQKLDVPVPVIFFLSINDDDIKPEKKEAYNHLAPSLKSMINEFFKVK